MASIIKQFKDSNGNNIYPIACVSGGMKMDLLWTNPSPTSSFAAQTLSIDLTKYTMIYVTCYDSIAVAYSSETILIGSRGQLKCLGSTSNNYYGRRNVITTTSSVEFQQGLSGDTAANTRCIPNKIYGIKTSYIVPTNVQGLQYIEV